VGRPERRALGTPKCRWEVIIKTDLQEVGWRGAVCIDLVHHRDRWQAVMNVEINLRVPLNMENFLTR
jgi:hypothetical protein